MGKTHLVTECTLSAITISLGRMLLLLDTWAIVDATAEGIKLIDASCLFLEMLINRSCLEITDIILLHWWNTSCFHYQPVCAVTIGDDSVILAFWITLERVENSPLVQSWKMLLMLGSQVYVTSYYRAVTIEDDAVISAFSKLVIHIPQGKQLATFSKDCYIRCAKQEALGSLPSGRKECLKALHPIDQEKLHFVGESLKILSGTIRANMLSKLVNLWDLDLSNNSLLPLSNNGTGVNYSFWNLPYLNFLLATYTISQFLKEGREFETITGINASSLDVTPAAFIVGQSTLTVTIGDDAVISAFRLLGSPQKWEKLTMSLSGRALTAITSSCGCILLLDTQAIVVVLLQKGI
ncbi:hypothetical protein SLA2020_102060 [Shorea laevis]